MGGTNHRKNIEMFYLITTQVAAFHPGHKVRTSPLLT
jgi:hypothetical protein